MYRDFRIVFFIGTLVLGFLIQPNAFAQQQVIIYGDKSYPPYSYEEDGVARGIYVDILKMAFGQMADYEVTIKMVPWKRGLDYIKDGNAFALFPPYKDEDRKAWMHFSTPILEEQIVVYGKAEKMEGKTKWPEDFYGARFGLNLGFSQAALGGEKFSEACESGKIKLQEANSTDQNLGKMKAGRIDFYINDRLTDISAYPSIKRGMVVNTNQGHLGFTKKDDAYGFASEFRQKFNEVIEAMKDSKEIEKVLEQYIK